MLWNHAERRRRSTINPDPIPNAKIARAPSRNSTPPMPVWASVDEESLGDVAPPVGFVDTDGVVVGVRVGVGVGVGVGVTTAGTVTTVVVSAQVVLSTAHVSGLAAPM